MLMISLSRRTKDTLTGMNFLSTYIHIVSPSHINSSLRFVRFTRVNASFFFFFFLQKTSKRGKTRPAPKSQTLQKKPTTTKQRERTTSISTTTCVCVIPTKIACVEFREKALFVFVIHTKQTNHGNHTT